MSPKILLFDYRLLRGSEQLHSYYHLEAVESSEEASMGPQKARGKSVAGTHAGLRERLHESCQARPNQESHLQRNTDEARPRQRRRLLS